MQPTPRHLVAARVAARLGHAVWRHRLGLLVSGLLIGALATFQISAAGPSVPGSGTDCADTTMAALTRATDDAARAAYACLEPEMRQGQGEDAFVATLQRRGPPPNTHVTRVGDHRTATGGRVVFYSVDVGPDSVGYIIYLDEAGKVERID